MRKLYWVLTLGVVAAFDLLVGYSIGEMKGKGKELELKINLLKTDNAFYSGNFERRLDYDRLKRELDTRI